MRWIALLRGINLGPRHKFPMARVRAVFEAGGARNVTTFIASGNVVFDHDERSEAKLCAQSEAALTSEAGFDVPVMLRTRGQLEQVLKKCPFSDQPTKFVHVTFLAKKPAVAALRAIDASDCAPESFAVVGRDVYLLLPNGMGVAKLPPKLNGLRVIGTTRTWQTVSKLAELARG
jgi:uncharacterized protein (DUF1697 family)